MENGKRERRERESKRERKKEREGGRERKRGSEREEREGGGREKDVANNFYVCFLLSSRSLCQMWCLYSQAHNIISVSK